MKERWMIGEPHVLIVIGSIGEQNENSQQGFGQNPQ